MVLHDSCCAVTRRLVHVVATNAFAGTERYVAILARAQAERGDEVTVVGGLPDAMRPLLGARVVHAMYAGPARTLRQLRSMPPPHLVHAHLTAAELLSCTAFLASRQVTIVSTRHIAARRGSSPSGRLAAHLIRRRIDGQIAPSRYLAARVDGPSEVILTGIPDSPMGTHDQPVVLVAQRLEAEKDTATALRAWAASGLGPTGWRLEVAGSGSEERSLRELATTLGITPSCTFLGQVDDVGPRMARAAVVLCTAPADSFGLTAVEAMACGTSVVASAAGGHVETVGALEGAELYPPGDHTRAADQLKKLAGDPSYRDHYGNRLRRLQQAELSIVPFVDRVTDFYDRVVSERRVAPREVQR